METSELASYIRHHFDFIYSSIKYLHNRSNSEFVQMETKIMKHHADHIIMALNKLEDLEGGNDNKTNT